MTDLSGFNRPWRVDGGQNSILAHVKNAQILTLRNTERHSSHAKVALLSTQRGRNLFAEFLSVHVGCELNRARGTRIDGGRWLLLQAAVVV